MARTLLNGARASTESDSKVSRPNKPGMKLLHSLVPCSPSFVSLPARHDTLHTIYILYLYSKLASSSW